MPETVFTQAIDFINQVNPLVINVSGGEPTLHGDILPMIKRLKSEVYRNPEHNTEPQMTLITNGTFYSNSRIQLCNIQRTGINIQITHDTRFYKNSLTPADLDELKKCSNDKLFVVTEIEDDHMIAYGNALINNTGTSKTRVAPMCFNLRSLVTLSGFDFKRAVQEMERRLKFCAWAIKPNGEIILSESLLCPPVGSITDSVQKITQNIREFRCRKCVYAQTLQHAGKISNEQYHKVFGRPII